MFVFRDPPKSMAARRSSNGRQTLHGVASVAAFVGLFIGGTACSRTDSRDSQAPVSGVSRPTVLPADQVRIPDGLRVVGVVVGNQARAYALDAMATPNAAQLPPDSDARLLSRHVVNDQLNGRAISVTYCERTDTARVFTATQAEPLDLRIVGWQDNSLLLAVGKQTFPQSASTPPLDTFEFQRTTWGQWRTENPRTEIYLGDLRYQRLLNQ